MKSKSEQRAEVELCFPLSKNGAEKFMLLTTYIRENNKCSNDFLVVRKAEMVIKVKLHFGRVSTGPTYRESSRL